jgi:hypothetical protein
MVNKDGVGEGSGKVTTLVSHLFGVLPFLAI